MNKGMFAGALVAALVIASGPLAHAKSAKYTGCLAKGDGPKEFKLTNVDGGSDEYELVGGGKDLKNHVGHKVEVTGTKISSKKAEKAEHAAGKGEAGENESAHRHLRVASMRHIAETCP